MKTVRAWPWLAVMTAALCTFGYGLALADELTSSTSTVAATPQSLSALWPMFAVSLASLGVYGVRKLSAQYTFFHTGAGAAVLTVIGAFCSSIPSAIQANGLCWAMLAWAALGTVTSLTALLNPSVPLGQPAPSHPAARGLSVLLPLVFLFSVAGCATAGGKALATCELGKLPQSSQAVLTDVSAIAVAGGANWQGELEQLGATLAPGQFDCALQAIIAAWSASHGALTPERAAALGRLEQYATAHPARACGPGRTAG